MFFHSFAHALAHQVATTTTPTPLTEEDVYLAWGAVIANWDENVQKRPKHVRQLVRDGIPEAVRGLAWQLLSKSFDSPLKETYGELLEVTLEHVGN